MRLPTIQVSATIEDVEQYKALLRADWSRDTLSQVLTLLQKRVVQGLNPKNHPWQNLLLESVERKSSNDFDPIIVSRIRDLSSVFRESVIAVMPDSFGTNRPNHSSAFAERVWTFLIIQALADTEGAIGLLADAQSLLFLCSAHHLLPELRRRKHHAEHDCLVSAMYVHTLLVWKALPAHMFYLQTVLMDQLGEEERHLELLDLSFLLTAPEDHAYLISATGVA